MFTGCLIILGIAFVFIILGYLFREKIESDDSGYREDIYSGILLLPFFALLIYFGISAFNSNLEYKKEIANYREQMANYEITTYEYTIEHSRNLLSRDSTQGLTSAIIQDIGIIRRGTGDFEDISKRLPFFVDFESRNVLGGIYSGADLCVVVVQNQIKAKLDHYSIIVDEECVATLKYDNKFIVGEGDIPWAMWENGKITITSECKLDKITVFLILAKNNIKEY